MPKKHVYRQVAFMLRRKPLKLIPLSHGQYAKVDDEDFVRLAVYKWNARWSEHTKSYYAIGPKHVRMHRFLMNPPRHLVVDHINRDTLDNRRENLRVCTKSENQWNRIGSNKTSKYKGVHWDKKNRKWGSTIMLLGKKTWLGRFSSEIEAAKAYDNAARHFFGEFALTNHSQQAIPKSTPEVLRGTTITDLFDLVERVVKLAGIQGAV